MDELRAWIDDLIAYYEGRGKSTDYYDGVIDALRAVRRHIDG